MTPALEHRIAVTSCETGSYEKCSKVCEEWGCSISDDKSMDVVKEIGKSCKDSDLPRLCEDAAGKADTKPPESPIGQHGARGDTMARGFFRVLRSKI